MTRKVLSPIWGLLDQDDNEDNYGFTQVIKTDQLDSKPEKKVESTKSIGLEELLFGE